MLKLSQRQKNIAFIFIALFFVFTISESRAVYSHCEASEETIRIKQETSYREILFGTSLESRPITSTVFGSGNETILLFGGIHGNEKGTVDLLNKLTHKLEQNPQLIGKNKQIIILPLANPDGYMTRTDKRNANNVNLNRNFPTTEWEPNADDIFAGNEPFSEPESRIVKQIVEKYDPAAMISFHSLGALAVPEYTEPSEALAQWYADQTGYEYFDEWDFAGTATRWFEETYKRPAVTIELTNHRDSDWNINKAALLELIGETSISDILE